MMLFPALVRFDVIPLCSPRVLELLAADCHVRQAYHELARDRPALIEQGRRATFRAGTPVTVLNLLRRDYPAGGAPRDRWLAPGPVPGCGILMPRPAGLYALIEGECWDGEPVWAVVAGRCLLKVS